VWDAGHVAHTRGRSAVPGLWFIGLPWQHSRGSALLGFVGEDAAWVAGQLAAAGSTPVQVATRNARPVPLADLGSLR
jgi:putative flavoprotein involved in K+ transport